MPRLNLTIQQQRLVRAVVTVLKDQRVKLVFWNFVPGKLTFDDDTPADPITATQSDLDAIEAARLIRQDAASSHDAVIYEVQLTAVSAVQHDFGWGKPDIVRRAMHEIVGDDRQVGCTYGDVVSYTGLTDSQVRQFMDALRHADETEMVLNPKRPVGFAAVPRGEFMHYRLTGKALLKIDAPFDSGHTSIHVSGHVGAISTGASAQNFVTQNISDADLNAQILALFSETIAGLKRELPAEFESLRADIEDLQKQLESGKPDPEKAAEATKGMLRTAGAWIKGGVGVADALNKSYTFYRNFSPLLPLLSRLFGHGGNQQ
jgi:hypothetical protein